MGHFWSKTKAIVGAQTDAEKKETVPLDPAYIVKWAPNDPLNPQNWTDPYRWWVTFQLGMLALLGSLGSSITTPADKTIAKYIGVSDEVVILDLSLYLLGFVLGPIIWAPISEIWGRRVSILPAVFCQALFFIATGVSKDAASVFVTRFFAGFFGSAPISNVTAALGDMWSKEQRGTAVSMYAIAVNGGPALGPVIGAALVLNPHLGWRWTVYIQAIWGFTIFLLAFFCLPEVFPLVLLKRKAQQLRKETNEPRYYHPHEHLKLDFRSILTKQLARPLIMLFTEPIVTCVSFYAAFVYGVMYLALELFPIIFEQTRGWGPVVGALPFLGLLIGVVSAVGINNYNQSRYNRISKAANGRAVPEARLPPMILGGIFLVTGLFWFAWTGAPPHHWILPCLAAVFIGFGFNCIFQQCLNYLIDVYKIYAASATAAVTFLRSLMAAGLPLAARPMVSALGIGPSVSIIGAVAAVLLPVPFLFIKYGPRLRKLSKLAPDDL
ncbi:major facilitator superfamily domain-containing protein [Talaromyces proteolyticus]|uniref:Major facilitator superfamily domain-containing protein n=1 Tax=Talaromyces proteolyticus TaxID=1131652 RepID=A0AAD4KIR3_9EURO|nr:major facilitator superfamily domain-containing protein [Talaromyces proteolyticus]KAH8692152.1 major facilitator superfamily domain-containing protein [Talaromyces proteolyticus]